MARCANCGCEIPNEEKTRLCEDCKRVILPFIKFMEASTMPAVKRLLSNEKNLRNAGVTDNGMDYLYRICELQDRRRQSEQEAKAMSRTAAAYGKAAEEPDKTDKPDKSEKSEKASKGADAQEKKDSAEEPEDEYDEEERERDRISGAGLTAAKWIMILSGTAALVWFAAKVVTRHLVGESLTDSIDVAALSAAFASYAGAYVASAVRKALRLQSSGGKE